MDIKSSFIYDSKIANEAYASKAGAAAAKENKLATGQKVASQSSDAASLQIKSKVNDTAEAAIENAKAAASAVEDVARAEAVIREANRRILESSDDSVLAQANQSTEAVTKLLG